LRGERRLTEAIRSACLFELADQESRLLKLKVIWSEIWKVFASENEIETVFANSGAMLVLMLNLESSRCRHLVFGRPKQVDFVCQKLTE